MIHNGAIESIDTGSKIVQIVEGHGIHRPCADVGRPLSHDEGVAVGRRAKQAGDADGAAGAAHILDDHGLAERLVHALAHDARHDIGHTARRERHDHRDRPRRISLRGHAGQGGQHGKYQRNRQLDQLSSHGVSPHSLPTEGVGLIPAA
jgi:hypothetical protein